jgi:hypothetical protein
MTHCAKLLALTLLTLTHRGRRFVDCGVARSDL